MNIYTASTFGFEMSIEKVGGHRKRVAVSALRQLSLSEEEKVRFSRGEVVFNRDEVRGQATNVAEIDGERVRHGSRTSHGVVTRRDDSGSIYGPSPWGLRGRV